MRRLLYNNNSRQQTAAREDLITRITRPAASPDSPEQACPLLQPRSPPSPHPQPQAAPEEHEDRYTILIIVNIFAAFGGAPNERRVSPRERAKEEAKAKEVQLIGAKDLDKDRRMEAQQDACNIR